MSNDYLFIYNKLFDHYGPQDWWPAETDFEMMIGAILVQNTSWRNVEKAFVNLKPVLDPVSIEKLSEPELAELIKSSGFFNIKAKRIKSFLEWFKGYHYEVDRVKRINQELLRKELLSIKGIGRETADVMLVYAFDKPAFVVDAYARRIFYRFGFDMPASYDGFKDEVEQDIPKDIELSNEYHALLVEHAKIHCKATPLCEGCPLENDCAKKLD